MNYGPFLFLGSFLALLLSWAGLIVVPQIQLKDLSQVKDDTTGLFIPSQPVGEARQGADVYRANGCNYCHSQQVQQTGYAFDIVLDAAGDFPDMFALTLVEMNPAWEDFEAEMMAMDEGGVLFEGVDLYRKNFLEKKFDEAKVGDIGVKIRYVFKPTGPDISRGWGPRASVAADYLFAQPAMIGGSRLGPDLTSIGSRQPDDQTHFRHLYAPRSTVKGSTMPSYQYLFKKQRIGDTPSKKALKLEGDFSPEEGFEIVPKKEAEQLVAYLKSLRVVDSLPEAPMLTE